MSFLTDFPNAVEYQRDLGYLIEQYKELSRKYAEYGERIKKIEDEISGLPAYVQRLVYEQTAALRADIEKQLSEMQNKIDKNVATVNELKEIVNLLQTQYAELSKMIVDLMQFVETYTDKIGEQVYQRLKELVDEWSKDLPPVICPVDGNLESVETALYHVYTALRRGLTAKEYEDLLLTAKVYDDYRIRAIDYDTMAREILIKWKCCYMLSPFSGTYEKIADVVVKLAAFHMSGVTASYFDALKLNAENFDGKEIDAYNYDWNNPLKE